MNLELIQSSAKTLLDAYAPLSGVPILADDGTYPQTPDRETALNTQGVCVVIWQIVGGSLTSTVGGRGRHLQTVELPISVEENRVVNQTSPGLQISAEKIVRLVLACLQGNPSDTPFQPANPPWANFGNVDGISQWIINLTIQSNI